MQVGMKVYSENLDYVEPLSFADFIEVLIMPGIDWTPLKQFDVKYKIHAAHHGFGVNLADPHKTKFNDKCINEALDAAHALDSPTIVLHPCGDLREGSIEQLYKQLEKHSEKNQETKILLENLPNFPCEKRLGTIPNDFPPLLKMGYGFCFDFGHMIATCAHNQLDYEQVTQEFMKLKPHYFHVSNGLVRSDYDLHLPLTEGDFDLEFFRKTILKDEPSEVTLETPFSRENKEEYKAFKEGVFV